MENNPLLLTVIRALFWLMLTCHVFLCLLLLPLGEGARVRVRLKPLGGSRDEHLQNTVGYSAAANDQFTGPAAAAQRTHINNKGAPRIKIRKWLSVPGKAGNSGAMLNVGVQLIPESKYLPHQPIKKNPQDQELKQLPYNTAGPVEGPESTQQAGLGDEYVVGGEAAPKYVFPYQALLGVWHEKHRKLWNFCGGSFVARKWVLSAAHCMFKCDESDSEARNKSLVVILGDHNRTALLEPDEQWFRVKRSVYHQDWKPCCEKGKLSLKGGLLGDLVLLELRGEADLSKQGVQIIELPRSPKITPFGNAVISGWGLINHHSNGTPISALRPDILRYVKLPIVKNGECRELYKNHSGIQISRVAHVCGGIMERGGSKASCRGDSGGPLVCQEQLQEDDCDERASPDAIAKPYLCGVVSFGTCGRVGLPSVFTNVAHYLPWIKEVITRTSSDNPDECIADSDDEIASGKIYSLRAAAKANHHQQVMSSDDSKNGKLAQKRLQ